MILMEKQRTGQCTSLLPSEFFSRPAAGSLDDRLTLSRENAKLPSFTRVPNPYREMTAEIEAEEAAEVDVSMQAGPSRHPALPTEAWTTLFSIHYKNYRKVS